MTTTTVFSKSQPMLLAVAVAAIVQHAAAADEKNISSLPTVKVSADATNTAAESTVSYDKEQLDKLKPLDMKDVFKRDANVAVGGSIAANQKVYVRGVEETAMAVTVDGARQNNKVFHHNTTNLIDPSLLKAVRASAGISPADDGPGAVGGSIVYETVDVADVLAPADNFGGFASIGYRTNGSVLTKNGALMGRSAGFEALGYVNRHDGNDYEDGNGRHVRFTEPALKSGLAKLAYETASVGRFEASHESTNDDSARPYRANLVSVQGRPVPESREYDLARDNTVLQYSRDMGRGLWNPSVMVSDSKTEVSTTEVPIPAPDTTISYIGSTSSASAKLKNVFYTAPAKITAGMDYYDDKAKFSDQTDPGLIQETAENLGLFVQVRQDLAKIASLSYGFRHDDQTFTGTNGAELDQQGNSANVSGHLHLGQHVSLNAGYAKVWSGVALAENYILNRNWNYSGGVTPVESDNYSVGIKSRFNGVLLEANIFETDIKNGRTPTWSGGPGLLADFVIDGFDVLVGYIGERGEITVAYADIESKKDSQVATSYDGNYFTVPLGRLITLNAELNFYDARVQLGLNAENGLKNKNITKEGGAQDEYLVLNAYADYQLQQNLALRVSVDNISDKAYVDRATYGQEFNEVVSMYEPGRSVGLNLRYEFR